MLTRDLLERRLRRIAGNLQLFASRRSTSARDRTWATETIATLASVPMESTDDTLGATQSDARNGMMRELNEATIAALAATGGE